MLESVNPDLEVHRGSPTKHPERRLETIRLAGELKIPFTTGILVGIGETPAERVQALEAIAAVHAEHGHVQEVILQNFVPHPRYYGAEPAQIADAAQREGTRGRGGADAGVGERRLAWTRCARLVRGLARADARRGRADPAEPRRLVAAAGRRGRHRPRRAVGQRRPHLARAPVPVAAQDAPRAAPTRPRAHRAAVRLPPVHGRRLARAGRARRDQGEVLELHPAPRLGPPRGARDPTRISCPARSNARATARRSRPDELTALFAETRPEAIEDMRQAADELRAELAGDTVTFVVNRNINVSNICTVGCAFCGFGQGKRSPDAYEHDREEFERRVDEAVEFGATEICMQSGIHPDWGLEEYEHWLRVAKEVAPEMHLHAYSAMEVDHMCEVSGLPPLEVFEPPARGRAWTPRPAPPPRCSTTACASGSPRTSCRWRGGWRSSRPRHAAGLRSTVTVMFGHIEEPWELAEHMRVVRELQERTGGFTEFVPLSLHPVPDPARAHARDRGDLARGEPQAHGRLPAGARPHDPEPPGQLGEDGARRGHRGAALGRERPGRDADGGEHQPHGGQPARRAARRPTSWSAPPTRPGGPPPSAPRCTRSAAAHIPFTTSFARVFTAAPASGASLGPVTWPSCLPPPGGDRRGRRGGGRGGAGRRLLGRPVRRFGRLRAGADAAPATGYGALAALRTRTASGCRRASRARRVALGGETVPGSDYAWHRASDGAAAFPTGRPRLDPRVELRGAARRRGGAAVRRRRGDPRRLPDPRRHHQQLRGRARRRGARGCRARSTARAACGSATRPASGRRSVHDAMGVFKHEAAAVDPRGRRVYLTEDIIDGAFYRFTPRRWPDLSRGHAGAREGRRERRRRVGGRSRPARRGASRPAARCPGYTEFARAEGIWFDSGPGLRGHDRRLAHPRLRHARGAGQGDLRRARPSAARRCCGWTTSPPRAAGELFVCEDISTEEIDMGVITRDRRVSRFLSVTGPKHAGSELTGVAFGPVGRAALLLLAAGGGGPGRGVRGLRPVPRLAASYLNEIPRRTRNDAHAAVLDHHVLAQHLGHAQVADGLAGGLHRRTAPLPPRTRCCTPITSVTR